MTANATRCDRCDVPGPNHPDASANGGVTNQPFMGGRWCVVCLDQLTRVGKPLPDGVWGEVAR